MFWWISDGRLQWKRTNGADLGALGFFVLLLRSGIGSFVNRNA